MCGEPGVRSSQFCCSVCLPLMPVWMRDEAMDDWRHRVTRPDRYAETFATVLLWWRDYRIWHQDKRLGEG